MGNAGAFARDAIPAEAARSYGTEADRMPGLTAPVGDCSAFVRLERRGRTRMKSLPLEAPAVEKPERMRIATRRQHEYNPSVTARAAGAVRAQSCWRCLG